MSRPLPAWPELELGLFRSGEVEPLERIPLHPVDVDLLTRAAELEKLSLGDFVVLASYRHAKEVLVAARLLPCKSTQVDPNRFFIHQKK